MNMAEKQNNFKIFTILSIPFVWLFETSSVGPALGSISLAFPGTSPILIKFIMTAPLITAILFSIISGWLAAHMDKKKILLAGLLIYTVAGIIPGFCNSISQIIISLLITGVGIGLVLPLANMIITQNYQNPEREKYLGLASSVANSANVIVSISVGFLLIFSWRFAFYSALLVGIIFIITLIGVPSCPPLPRPANSTAPRKKLPGIVFILSASMAFVWIVFAISALNLSLFMTEEKIGSFWMIGIAIAMPGLGAMFSGKFFTELKSVFRIWFLPLSFLTFGLGFLILFFSSDMASICTGSFLIGFGSGSLVPFILEQVAVKVKDPAQQEMAYGIVTPCIHLGIFLSPFFQLLLQAIGHTSSYRFLFITAGFLLLLIAVSIGVYMLLTTRHCPITAADSCPNEQDHI